MLNFVILSLFAFSLSAAQAAVPAFDVVRKNCRQGIEKMSNSFPASPRFPSYSPILDRDRAEDLVENPALMIRNLKEMEDRQLLSRKLSVAPWSDTYWPLYLGGIAQRYNDPSFKTLDWKSAYSSMQKSSAEDLIRNQSIDQLAPSEKYDFWLGLTGQDLTAGSWAEGKSYFDRYGNVETWMGLCHGWAAASIMMPDPKKNVEVTTATGSLVFHPSDIKAFATDLWAKGETSTRFIGGRCNIKNPPVDGMGRPVAQDCLDSNPGTWHQAIVNQIGQFDRAFVMDASTDYQVWNQPVYGYEYTYYNPTNQTKEDTLLRAAVKVRDWSNDPRKEVRAPGTDSVAGIKMQVTYVVESGPDTGENQEAEFRTVEYSYDLELDQNLNIIGGEWYSENHPDFLWVPAKGTFPPTSGDGVASSIDLNHLSSRIVSSAKIDARNGLPSGQIVKKLFELSAQ